VRKWLVALALAAGLSAEAQQVPGGLLGRGASYTSFVPPTSCASGYVPYFDASLKMACAPTVYAPTTNTTTVGTLAARNVVVTALPASGSVTVTPVLSKVGSITTVAGSALVDGDYFTIEYAAGLTVPIEFDATPGDGTSGGRVPYVFAPGDTADQIRDGLITLLNTAAGTQLTASSGGAATVALVLDTPGAAGGTNSENVANAGFAVTGFVNPTAATTYTYSLQACLADGTCNAAGPASSTAAGVATLSASNFNRLSWSAVPGSALYKIRRDVGGATQGVIWTGTALTVDDTGLAGGGETAPSVNGTGVVTAGRVGTATVQQTGAVGTNVAGSVLTISPQPGTGNAAASYILFTTPTPGVSGAGAQTLVTRMLISASGVFTYGDFKPDTSDARGIGYSNSLFTNLFMSRATLGSKAKAIADASPTAFATFTIADAASYSGKVIYSVKAVKGTALQTLFGEVGFSATREGSTYTAVVGTIAETASQVLAAAAGTLTGGVTIACTGGVCTLSANFDTSQATPDTFIFNYRFNSTDAALAITPL